MMLNAAGLARQRPLPVGFDRRTRKLVSLEQAMADPGCLVPRSRLTRSERNALVRRRWGLGEWVDLLSCDQRVDLRRGIAELEKGTKIGRDLLRVTEGAIDMLLEDTLPGCQEES
jgi:hypothetical protein